MSPLLENKHRYKHRHTNFNLPELPAKPAVRRLKTVPRRPSPHPVTKRRTHGPRERGRRHYKGKHFNKTTACRPAGLPPPHFLESLVEDLFTLGLSAKGIGGEAGEVRNVAFLSQQCVRSVLLYRPAEELPERSVNSVCFAR